MEEPAVVGAAAFSAILFILFWDGGIWSLKLGAASGRCRGINHEVHKVHQVQINKVGGDPAFPAKDTVGELSELEGVLVWPEWVAPTDANMQYDPNKHHRHSVRLNGYDYSQAGLYFVTIVTHNHACLLGKIVDGEMRLNYAGQIARQEWQRLEKRFSYVRLDAFVIMSNHIHGTTMIRDKEVGATQQDNYVARPVGPSPGSLGAIIGQFKSRVTKRLCTPVWQRNYYKHVIRDSEELDRIRRYIESNHFNWMIDDENPERTK